MQRRLERVIPVQVDQIDAAVGEMFPGFVEGGSNQPREGRETAIVIGGPFLEDCLVEEARVRIATPRVHAVARGGETKGLHRLREARVAVAGMAPQLHEHRRLQHVDDPEGERRVIQPGWGMDHALRLHERDRAIEEPEIEPVRVRANRLAGKVCYIRHGRPQTMLNTSARSSFGRRTASVSRCASCSRQLVVHGTSIGLR